MAKLEGINVFLLNSIISEEEEEETPTPLLVSLVSVFDYNIHFPKESKWRDSSFNSNY